MAGSLNDTYTENPFSLIPTWSPPWPDLTWPPYMTGPLEYSELPTIMSTPEPENSLFKNISLAVRVVLFIVCLIENSIAIYILCKIIKNGREVFSRSILINMACADISTTLLLYPVEFVNFHHGEYFWVVEGQLGDVLCKLYSFVFHIPGRVLTLSLVALAWDVTRNLSSRGRKEHTRKFSARLIVFFWIFAATPSIMYIAISRVKWNMCSIDWAKDEKAAVTMDKIHLYVFVISGDLILTILNLIVFFRVRRRKKEIKRKRGARSVGKMKAEARRKKCIGDKKYAKVEQWRKDTQGPMLSNKGWCQLDGEYFPAGAIPQQQSNLSETLIEMSNGNKHFTEVDEASNITVVHVDQEDDGSISANESDEEESFETTRKEAKITGVASTLFVVLSIIEAMFWYVCPGPICPWEYYGEYVAFAIEIAKGIYAALKPAIYAGIDKEFRKRYTQLSPLACCCFRRILCHKEPNQVGTTKRLSTQVSNV